MRKITPRLRAVLLVIGLLVGSSASAQLTVIYGLDFNNPAAPWASTGSVAMTGGAVGTLTVQNTDLVPGAGNAYSAVFDGSQYQIGSSFSGINTSTTGYGIQLWIKNPGSTYPSEFWSSIVSNGQPNDDGNLDGHNGIALGMYDGSLWGVSNSTFQGLRSNEAPGGAGSINGWDHLAVVADGSTLRLFQNGVLIGSRTASFEDPSTSWHLFASAMGFPAYTGLADDLKIFTFATGTFSASALDYNVIAVPEPSTYAVMIGVAMLGVAAWRRRGSPANTVSSATT